MTLEHNFTATDAAGNELPVSYMDIAIGVDASGNPEAVQSGFGQLGAASATPTVSASPDYASGDAVGGIMTFAGVTRGDGGTAYITAVLINSKAANTAQMDLFLFSANPSSSTVTDNAAFALHADDAPNLIGVVPVSNWYSGGTPSVGFSDTCRVPVQGQAADDIYGVLVARGAVNLASTSDISVFLTPDKN